jgi:hypothetical protein
MRRDSVASSRDRLRDATDSAAMTVCSSRPRSATDSSIAATAFPPGPNTGIATPDTPVSSSQRVTATRVRRVTVSARRRRSGEVIVCAVKGRSPPRRAASTTSGSAKASSARPRAVACAGRVAAGLNGVTGRCPGCFSM